MTASPDLPGAHSIVLALAGSGITELLTLHMRLNALEKLCEVLVFRIHKFVAQPTGGTW